MTGLAVMLLWTAACALLGHGWLGRRPRGGTSESLAFSLALAFLAGLTLWTGWLILLSGAEVRLGQGILAALLVLAAVIGVWRLRPSAAGSRAAPASQAVPPSMGWGAAVAAASLLAYLICTFDLWNVHPDFIYHWGIKAKKTFLAGGLDFDYLGSPANPHIHPDYPHLLPLAYASISGLAGSFAERPLLLWSGFFFLVVLISARELLLRARVSRFACQAALACLGLVLLLFGVGYLQAGGADWLMAAAVTAGSALLLGEHGRRTALQVGAVAAFAVAAKLEGLPLAVSLVALYLLPRVREGWKALIAPALRTLVPASIMVALWLAGVLEHGLFQESNTGGFELARVPLVVDALWDSLFTVNWHGLTFLLFALPLLLASRRLRPVAGLCLLQLAFYVYAYLTGPVDTRYWIETSAARLYFHVLPVTLVAVVVGLEEWAGVPREPREA